MNGLTIVFLSYEKFDYMRDNTDNLKNVFYKLTIKTK